MVRTSSIFLRTGRCSWSRAPSQGHMLNSWGQGQNSWVGVRAPPPHLLRGERSPAAVLTPG